MARAAATLALVVLLALAFTDNAAATLGKGKFSLFGKGKGSSVSFTTQCEDVCRDKCKMTPKKTCEDVQVPYKECSQVPVTSTRKSCSKVCTTVTETPAVTEAPAMSKGKAITLGKGRHLLKKGKAFMVAPKAKVSCEDVCKDVPMTTYETKCEDKTRTAQSCKISLEQTCEKKCRPVCTKVPVVVEAPKVEAPKAEPVMVMSKGKGKLGH